MESAEGMHRGEQEEVSQHTPGTRRSWLIGAVTSIGRATKLLSRFIIFDHISQTDTLKKVQAKKGVIKWLFKCDLLTL